MLKSNFRRALSAGLLLGCLASAGHAQNAPDRRSALDQYRGNTQYALLICATSLRTALLRAELGEPEDEKGGYRGCIVKNKAEAKASLDKALRTIKSPRARDALKSFHVAFVTALEGIAPGIDERRISYESRQQALEGKVTEAWARFEVEQ
jgi:hypothetical protein